MRIHAIQLVVDRFRISNIPQTVAAFDLSISAICRHLSFPNCSTFDRNVSALKDAISSLQRDESRVTAMRARAICERNANSTRLIMRGQFSELRCSRSALLRPSRPSPSLSVEEHSAETPQRYSQSSNYRGRRKNSRLFLRGGGGGWGGGQGREVRVHYRISRESDFRNVVGQFLTLDPSSSIKNPSDVPFVLISNAATLSLSFSLSLSLSVHPQLSAVAA